MEGVLSANTIRWYKNRLPSLVQFLNNAEIDTITTTALRAWRASLAQKNKKYVNHPYKPTMEGKLSPFTLHQYVRAAKRLFRWLHQEGYLSENPADRLELPQLPDYTPKGITTEDRDLIINAVSGIPRDFAIVLFLCDTACRVGGVSNLKLEDLDLAHRRAFVHEKGRAGGQKSRPVFFTERTARALRNYLANRPHLPDCDYVFVGCKNGTWGRLSESGIYDVLERAALRAGVSNGYNPHSFRHGAIRGMLANGLSLPEVSQIAGHSSTKVTGDIYGCFDENHLAKRHEQFSWLRQD